MVILTNHSRFRLNQRSDIDFHEAETAIENGKCLPIVEDSRRKKSKGFHMLYYSPTHKTFQIFIVEAKKKSGGREAKRLRTVLVCNSSYISRYPIPSEIFESAMLLSNGDQ